MAGTVSEVNLVDVEEGENEIPDGSFGTHDAIEEDTDANDVQSGVTEPQDKIVKLPLSRIRNIIKTDPDVRKASQDAVIVLAKAAELFIQSLATDTVKTTLREKKKTITRDHLDNVFSTKDRYSFLEGVLESFES